MAALPRLLVTGATGLLAPYVIEAAKGFELLSTSRRGGTLRADLSCPDEVERLLHATRPDAVIHTAGFTDVDGCQKEPVRAFEANAMAARLIAKALSPQCHLIIVSTDQVYGDCGGPHLEDAAAPINEYGRSKLAGEWGACAAHAKTCVLRTNFFGNSRSQNRMSLSDFIIGELRAKREFTLFDDVLFSPLHICTLASLLIEIVQREITGVFNAAARDGTSKAAFGLKIAVLKKLDASNARIGASHEIQGRAPRPLDLRLNVEKLETVLGRSMPALEREIGLI